MRTLMRKFLAVGAICSTIGFSACGSDEATVENENEVFTTVILTFTPEGGGTPVVAKVNDADGDGGNPAVVEPIVLAAGAYDLSVKFENRLETPAEDLTVEVKDEGDQHFVFFTGTAVSGPASAQLMAPLTQAYSDLDVKGLPIGLSSKIAAVAGTGTLTVTLRHMPPVNGLAVKTAASPETVKASGFATLGGSTDVQVSFPATVQ